MATPKRLCDQAISQLKEQAERFDAMSLLFAKSPHLARHQADEIADWSFKLIDAVNKIRNDAQAAATAWHERLQNQIQDLEGQANSTKRKILDTNQLDSSRTLRANFRLIFGPAKSTENRAATTRHLINASAERITTIRALCESNPDSVITLSTSYPTKTWTASSLGVFEGIIGIVKRETQLDWPDEIIDIMDELEAERPMSVEFRNLRGMYHANFRHSG